MENTIKKFVSKWQNTQDFDYDAESGTTSNKYATFQKEYKSLLRKIANNNDWSLDFMPNHYEFTAVFSNGEKYAYMSIPDVRYWYNQWASNILVRSMKNATDWTGGANRYTTIYMLENGIKKILND